MAMGSARLPANYSRSAFPLQPPCFFLLLHALTYTSTDVMLFSACR